MLHMILNEMHLRLQSGTVNVRTTALNQNSQYVTLLHLHKVGASTVTLHTVFLICKSFRVVQLMYSPLRCFKTTLRPAL